MRFFLGILFLAISAPFVSAQSLLDRSASGAGLQASEIRFLQAALAWSGHYQGLIDGQWGAGSQQALSRMARERYQQPHPRLREAALLARSFEKAVAREGWKPFHDPRANMSYLVPETLLHRENRSDGVAFTAAGRTLELASSVADPVRTAGMHQYFLRLTPQPNLTYAFPPKPRVVNFGQIAGTDRSFYLRSDRRGTYFASTVIQWRAEHANAARLIAASISDGTQPALGLPSNGLIHQAIVALDKKPDPGQDIVALELAGAGFYVNNTDLVTDLSLVRQCKALRLKGGARPEVVATAPAMGLAVLTAPRRSNTWLAIKHDLQANPGEAVAAQGYALYAQRVLDPAPTKGAILGEMRPAQKDRRLTLRMVSATGNLGAPVFNGQGQLIGVVSSLPANSQARVPQGQVLATPVARLGRMLSRNRIQHGPGPAKTQGNQTADPAIVPLFCEK